MQESAERRTLYEMGIFEHPCSIKSTNRKRGSPNMSNYNNRKEELKNFGKTKYLLFHWIIPCAIPIAAIFPLLRGLITGFEEGYFLNGYYFGDIVPFFILGLIICFIFGNREWKKIINQ